MQTDDENSEKAFNVRLLRSKDANYGDYLSHMASESRVHSQKKAATTHEGKKLVVQVEERRGKKTVIERTGFSDCCLGRAFTYKHLIFRLNNYSVHHFRLQGYRAVVYFFFAKHPERS